MGNSGSHCLGIPAGRGPNLVGCIDLMADHTIQGSFIRLYYPCEQGGEHQQPLWIPEHEYYYGLADFLKYNRRFVDHILNYLYGDDDETGDNSEKSKPFPQGPGSYRVPAEWDAPFKSDGKYPLVVFSHGLGAFRTLYSAICIEVASQGFVVAAVEHSEGDLIIQVPNSQVGYPRTPHWENIKDRTIFALQIAGMRIDNGAVMSTLHLRPHQRCAQWSISLTKEMDGSASATYYFEEKTKRVNEVGQSTSSTSSMLTLDQLEQKWLYYKPHKAGEKEFPFRNLQVHQRAEECIRALNLLTNINMGKPVHNVFPLDFDFTKMKDSLDLSKVTIMGHSFGGATVIDSLSKELQFGCGVALDVWMFPLEDEVYAKVQKPILFINSQKFQWVANILKMKNLDSNTIERKMITIMGTVHQSFPDFTFLTGSFLGKIFRLKGTIDPHIAIDISNKASLAFIQRHLGLEKDFDQWDPLIDGKGEHIIPGTNIHLPQSKSEPKQ